MQDEVDEFLEGPLPPKAVAVLQKADGHGWTIGHVSLTMRFAHPESELARPFFASWDVVKTENRKPSYRFTGAFAQNGQALNLNDVLAYLEDPALIWPEPVEEETG